MTLGFNFVRRANPLKDFPSVDLLTRNITQPLGVQASLAGMCDVFLSCHPFQVVGAVVGFVAVFVVHLQTLCLPWHKVLSNQPMNVSGSLFAVFASSARLFDPHPILAIPTFGYLHVGDDPCPATV